MLGINVTQSDPITTWGEYDRKCVHRKPRDVIEYEEARDESEEAWDHFVHNVDWWLEHNQLDILNEKKAECLALQNKTWKLAHQLHCPHTHTETIGSVKTYMGEYDDDIRQLCLDCGKEF